MPALDHPVMGGLRIGSALQFAVSRSAGLCAYACEYADRTWPVAWKALPRRTRSMLTWPCRSTILAAVTVSGKAGRDGTGPRAATGRGGGTPRWAGPARCG